MLLALSGLALFGVFLSGLLGLLLTPRLLDPAWQLRLVELLIGSSPFALLGSCLLLLGACLEPRHSWIEAWWQRTRQLAWIACLGYLLLIPLQASALWQMGQRVEQPVRQQIARLQTSLQAIEQSRSFPDLNQALRTLPGSPQLPSGVQLPLESVRSNASTGLRERLSQVESQQRIASRNRRVSEVLLWIRLAGISAMLSGVFAAIAMRDELRGSWLQQLSVARSQRSRAQGHHSRSRGAAEAAYVEQLSRDDSSSEAS
ncbi:MAG: hypothetical protein ACKOZW_13340 [Cyanobium sp.]